MSALFRKSISTAGTNHTSEHYSDIIFLLSDMCRELLAVTDILDPGASRLALYSSVLLNELYCAEFYLLRRAFEKDPPVLSAEETARRAMEAKGFLLRATEILEPEPQFSSGSKMLEVVRKALLECEAWMKDKRVDVPT
jgi:hypothetical protein